MAAMRRLQTSTEKAGWRRGSVPPCRRPAAAPQQHHGRMNEQHVGDRAGARKIHQGEVVAAEVVVQDRQHRQRVGRADPAAVQPHAGARQQSGRAEDRREAINALPTTLRRSKGGASGKVMRMPAEYSSRPQPQRRRPGASRSPWATARQRLPSRVLMISRASSRTLARDIAPLRQDGDAARRRPLVPSVTRRRR